MKYKKMIGIIISLSILCTGTVIPVRGEENTAPSAPAGLLTNELENPINTEDVMFGWLVNTGVSRITAREFICACV